MDGTELLKSGGWFTTVIFAVLAFWPKFKKAQLDDSSLAVETLQKICERNEGEIATLRNRLHETDALLDKERRERREAEDKYHAELSAMRDEIAGLKRVIIQNSYSSVQVIDGGKNAKTT